MAKNFNNDNINEYFKSISKIPLLSKDDENKWMKLAASGDEKAQKKLVESNLRFVVKIASSYKGYGLDLEDLVSEGNTGLIIAATKINPEKNVRFITYATWWIRQSINKALYDSGKAVRIPLNRKDEFYGEKWDSVSIYDKCSVFDNNSELCEILCDEKDINPEDSLMGKYDEAVLKNSFDSLSEDEKLIINYHYGINGYEKTLLADIGKMLGVSRETVRQREIKIINKIRHNIKSTEKVLAAA